MKKILILLVAMAAVTGLEAQKESSSTTPKKVEVVKFSPPVITVTGTKADDFYKRNPAVADISMQGTIITLKMKDQSKQKYDMSKKKEKDDFEAKYGKSPIPPPPPPKVRQVS